MIRKKIGHGSVVLESFTHERDENLQGQSLAEAVGVAESCFLTGINEELKKKNSIVTNTRQLLLAARISLIK